MFVMGDEQATRALVQGAGFDEVRLEEVHVEFLFADVAEFVERSRDTGGLFATAWNEASPDEQQSMRGELEEAFAQYEQDGRLVIPGVALCGVAS